MTPYIRVGIKREKVSNGIYWVHTKVNKDLILAEYNNGMFYRYDQFAPYVDQIDSHVTHYKRIPKPNFNN